MNRFRRELLNFYIWRGLQGAAMFLPMAAKWPHGRRKLTRPFLRFLPCLFYLFPVMAGLTICFKFFKPCVQFFWLLMPIREICSFLPQIFQIQNWRPSGLNPRSLGSSHLFWGFAVSFKPCVPRNSLFKSLPESLLTADT